MSKPNSTQIETHRLKSSQQTTKKRMHKQHNRFTVCNYADAIKHANDNVDEVKQTTKNETEIENKLHQHPNNVNVQSLSISIHVQLNVEY
jgi:hypothetical protein